MHVNDWGQEICYVFDIDDTLVKPRSIDVQKEDLFRYFKPVGEHTKMMTLFRKLQNQGHQIYLLTTRHPCNKAQIASYFGIPLDYIICRDFALGFVEIETIIKSCVLEAAFLRNVMLYKIKTIIHLMEKGFDVKWFDNDYSKIRNIIPIYAPDRD